MASAEEYAAWIVANQDKQGSPEFKTVEQAYKLARMPKYDPTEGMTGTEKFLAGTGKAFVDIGRGAGQMLGITSQEDIDEAKNLDAPLMKTGAGRGGNLLGNVAAAAPTMLIPGVNTYTGAALVGAGMGALQPTATGESRAANMAIGGAAGAAGQGLGKLAGRALRPVTSRLSPEEQVLAQGAQREGIPLSAGELTGSRPLKVAESVLEDLPFTSGKQLAVKETQQRAFTAAALRRAGMTADAVDPAALVGQKAALGQTMEGIANAGKIDFNRGLSQKLSMIVADANQHMPPAEAAKVSQTVRQIFQQVDQTGNMAGSHYQGWREPLRGLAGPDAVGRYMGQIRKALDSEFKSQVSGKAGQDFAQASRQYANLKTIMQAAGGPGAPAAKGQLAPSQLAAAVRQAMGKEGVAAGRGDLNELSRIGTTFMRDPIGQSGTAPRSYITNLLTGAGNVIPGAGVGAGVGYYTGGVEGAMLGAAGGAAGNVMLPRMAQALMQSPAGKAYLTSGAVHLTPAARKAITDAMRTATIGTALDSREHQ